MSSDIINNIVRRQYTAHKGDDLLSQVSKVLCIVGPHHFISAGFHPSGEVLIVNSSQFSLREWDTEFIKHELLDDPLLAATEMIKSVFIAATKNIIIPNELYNTVEIAQKWFKGVYFCEPEEKINVAFCSKSEVHSCYSFPKGIEELFDTYAAELSFLPLNLIHLQYGATAENLLQCTICEDYAIGTIHHNKILHWHQTFEYQNVEDIAYKLAAACQYFGIELQHYPVFFNTTSIDQQVLLKKLHPYIPSLQNKKTGLSDIISPEWSSTILLFQQLNTCA